MTVNKPPARARPWAPYVDALFDEHNVDNQRLDQLIGALGLITPSGDATGATDLAVINAAVTAAAALGGGTVLLSAGTYLLSGSINGKTGVTLAGPGLAQCTIRAVSGSAPVVQGASGDVVARFQLRGVTIDGGWTQTAVARNGVQITNGSEARVRECRFVNLGGHAVLLQGLGLGGGTPRSRVVGNYIDGAGLANGTNGFGILIKDASVDCTVHDNDIRNVVGGMGIGGNGSVGTGFPTHMAITGNTILMASSTTGFEAIGLTSGCDFATIGDNTITDSWDNGISYSAAYGSITGNTIDGTLNHGIAIVGLGTTVVGNTIRNVGKQNDATYGGVCITTGGRCVVLGNTIVDDQGTHTMSYGVKLITSAGTNAVLFNAIQGHSVSPFNGIVTGDYLLDITTRTNGTQTNRIYLDDIQPATAGQAMTATGDLRATSRFWVGSPGTGGGQLNVATNAGSTRPTLDVNRVGSQSVALQRWMHDNLSTVLAQVTQTGRIEASDGLTSKDLGDITGLTSAQIDALFAASPPNGTLATGLRSATPVMLARRNGAWNFTNMTVI